MKKMRILLQVVQLLCLIALCFEMRGNRDCLLYAAGYLLCTCQDIITFLRKLEDKGGAQWKPL